jgi:predicted N-acyltransferase
MLFSCDRVPDLRLSLNESLHMVHRADWNTVARGASPYLKYDHLLALEDRMGAAMDFRYVIYYSTQNRPVGIACFQVVDLEDRGSAYGDKLCRLGKHLGSRLLEDRRVRCLVAGNVFHAGDHGSHFLEGISTEQRIATVADTLQRLEKGDPFPTKASALIVKDINPAHGAKVPPVPPKSYHLMRTDANMVMALDPKWKSLDDYQAVLTAKARTRLKNVLKRSDALQVRSLDADGIEQYVERLQQLFDNVLARSTFVMGRLNVAVYADWKRQQGDALRLLAYELEGEIAGFSAAFITKDGLDAHYVGLDQEHNERYAVYQRMLVDHLQCALEHRVRCINFGRTAEQAKSNLGALPEDMYFLVRHRNPVANKLIGPFLRSVEPATFELREPFKKINA